MTKPIERVLVMRTCHADGASSHGFVWPESGRVKCPDWSPRAECGNGLHGLLWGEGDGGLLDWSEDARWLVVEVNAAKVVDLGGKVKFPNGVVVYCGDRQGAAEFICADPRSAGRAIVGATATAGDSGTATAGDSGTATAGDSGTATAGDSGTATAGTRGTATAGTRGTATAGTRGTATAGEDGVLVIHHYDVKRRRYVLKVAEVGKDVEPNKLYRLNADGRFVEGAG